MREDADHFALNNGEGEGPTIAHPQSAESKETELTERTTDAVADQPQATAEDVTAPGQLDSLADLPPELRAALAPATAEDPKPFTLGKWHDFDNYVCNTCGQGFGAEAEFWDHWRSKHIPAEQQAEAMHVLLFGSDGRPIEHR
jgi:hypothetical protein